MKKVFFFIIIAGGLISCNASKTTSANPVIEKKAVKSLNDTWQLQMLFSSDNNWSTTPFINIDINTHTFSGNSGCNTISGKFTIDGNYIAFDRNIISTKMACNGNYERSFLAALLKVNTYTINHDELELGQGEIVLMRFKRN